MPQGAFGVFLVVNSKGLVSEWKEARLDSPCQPPRRAEVG